MRYFDTTLLSTFVVVANSGTISSASPKLNLTNSTISEQLSKLEDFVGKKLMIRDRRGTSLTAEGQLLLIEAESILMSCSLALNKIRGINIAGEFRIAITDYFRPNDLTKILKRIQKKFPFLKLHISVVKSEDIKNNIFSNNYDLAIYMEFEDVIEGDTQPIKLLEEPLFWVKSHELEIDNSPLPIITMSSSCLLKDFTEQSLIQNKIPFYIAHTATGVKGITAAVEAGLGVSCLNKSALNDNIGVINSSYNLPELPNIRFMLYLYSKQNPTTDMISQILIEEFI